jgi:hypothetical protein
MTATSTSGNTSGNTSDCTSNGVGGGASSGAATGGAPLLLHAFDGAFLDRLLERDSPPTARRAAVAGPWEVTASGGGWRVHRQGEGSGCEPAAWFAERQDALLLAAALPASGGGEEVKLRPQRGPDGYAVVGAAGVPVGRLAWFDPELAAALATLRALVASPRDLALLLEASGHDALDHAGRLLAARAVDAP